MKALPQPRSGKRQALSPEEYRRLRRERRRQRTAHSESQVRAWADQRGCSLRVLNDGHHWLFEKPGFVAEWWPSSAKLAVKRDYLRTFHAPHWPQVAAVLESHILQKNPCSSASIRS